MTQFIVAFVAVCKSFNNISKYIDMFNAEWIKYDIDRIGGKAEAIKQEYEVLNEKLKSSTNDTESRAILRALNRIQ